MPTDKGDEQQAPPIIFFDFFYTFGGAQRSTATLLNWLKERAQRPCLYVSPSPPHRNFAEYLRADLFSLLPGPVPAFERTNAHRRQFLIMLPRLLRRLASLLRELELEQPVFVTSSLKGLTTLALFKLLYSGPSQIVFYARGDAAAGQFGRVGRFLLCRFVRTILCVSNATKKNLISLGVPSKKIHVVYTSVDVKDLLDQEVAPPRLDKPVVTMLFVGSLIPTKGLHHLIGALGHVSDASRLRLRVAGGCPNSVHESYGRALLEQAAALGPDADIEWCGWVQDVNAMLCQADIVCLPSYSEGFPRIVVESMALGRIVLATSVGGVSELITDGETGYTIELDEECIAGVLDRLLSSDDALTVSQAARRRIRERYSLDMQGRLVLDALAD